MRITPTVKFSIPGIILMLSYAIAFAAAWHSKAAFMAVHFPLELLIVASLIGCVVVVLCLFPRRKNPELRIPFFLNALILTALVLWIVSGVIMRLI